MRVRQPWFAIGFVGVLAIGATVALGSGLPGSGPSAAPTASIAASVQPGPETEPAAIATPSPSPSPDLTAAPSPAASASVSPTAKPGPTLDWANIGYTAGVKDPVALGGSAKVTLVVSVGPTCTLSARYPSGKSAAVGSPTHPKAGTWVWSWIVPGTAGLGQASVSFSCTYAGLAKPGTGSFTILATLPTPTPRPTPTPSWSIDGSVNSPLPMSGTLTFSGQVIGDPPPGIAPIDLRCELYITYSAGFDTLIAQDGSVQTRDFTLSGPINAPSAGSYPWHVTCYPTLVNTPRSKAGTLDAT